MTVKDPATALASTLAENLRFLRQRRTLTQAKLAKLCGVPRSTVAQLETGSGNPTLSVLARIAMALQLTIEEILSPPTAGCRVFPKGSLPARARGRDGLALVQRILPDPIPGMEIDRIELKPGARMTGIPHRPGTREYLACERGAIVLWTSGSRHAVASGDVAAFNGDQPHSYHNEGSQTAIGFSVVTLAPLSGATPPAPFNAPD